MTCAATIVRSFSALNRFHAPRFVMRLAAIASALAMVTMLTCAPARAALHTYAVSFTADTFQTGVGVVPAPVDPVTGSFTITLDPALAYLNDTADIVLNSLNLSLGSTLCFSYDPNNNFGTLGMGVLRVGGLFNGSDVIQYNPSTNDFWLYIPDFTGANSFEQVGYSQTSINTNNFFYTINQTGSVSVTEIPEPASLGLLTLGSLALIRRRRAA